MKVEPGIDSGPGKVESDGGKNISGIKVEPMECDERKMHHVKHEHSDSDGGSTHMNSHVRKLSKESLHRKRKASDTFIKLDHSDSEGFDESLRKMSKNNETPEVPEVITDILRQTLIIQRLKLDATYRG